MPGELIPIVLFVCLFAFLSIGVVAKMVTNVYRTRATLAFIQSLIDRGFSVSEIERVLKMCQGQAVTQFDIEELNSKITRPVPPVKQAVHSA